MLVSVYRTDLNWFEPNHETIWVNFAVICLYRSLASPEIDSAALRKSSELISNDVLDSPPLLDHRQFASLEEANLRILQLETKVRELYGLLGDLKESTPKKFPDVEFLNYKNRKRILVG